MPVACCLKEMNSLKFKCKKINISASTGPNLLVPLAMALPSGPLTGEYGVQWVMVGCTEVALVRALHGTDAQTLKDGKNCKKVGLGSIKWLFLLRLAIMLRVLIGCLSSKCACGVFCLMFCSKFEIQIQQWWSGGKLAWPYLLNGLFVLADTWGSLRSTQVLCRVGSTTY